MFRNATPAGHRPSPLAFVLRAFGGRFLPTSRGISAPARITLPTQKDAGAGQTLLEQRKALQAQIDAARPHSQRRAELVVRLRSLNNRILEAGRADH